MTDQATPAKVRLTDGLGVGGACDPGWRTKGQMMKAKHKRLFWTVVTPPFILLAALLMSALTQWLDQSIGGKLLMLLAMIGFAAKVGHMAWHWPGWTDDDA